MKNIITTKNSKRKIMITKTLSFDYHNSPRISLEVLLGEEDTSLEAAFEKSYVLCDFLILPDIQDIEYWSTLFRLNFEKIFDFIYLIIYSFICLFL